MKKVTSITERNRYWRRLDREIKEASHQRLRAHIDDAIRRVTAAAPAAAAERERLRQEAMREKVVVLPSAKRSIGSVVNLQATPVVSEDQRRLDRLAEFMATGTVKRKRRRRAKVIPIK